MAFVSNNLTVWSANPVAGVAVPTQVPAEYAYFAGADTISDVTENGYFYTSSFLGGQNLASQFNLNDAIYCVGSDANSWIYITQLLPEIETASLGSAVGPDSIGTAEIKNLAVTAAKIDNSTITTAQIAASAGILGTQLAASAAILGTQLDPSAGIVGTQLATSTITSGEIATNTITSAQLDLSVPQSVSLFFSSAQFSSAFTAGLLCIPAAGANTLINIINWNLNVNYLTASYADGGDVGLQYASTAPVNAGGVAASTTIGAADITVLTAQGLESGTGLLSIHVASQVANAGVWLTVDTANFTTGQGSIRVNIVYNVMQL